MHLHKICILFSCLCITEYNSAITFFIIQKMIICSFTRTSKIPYLSSFDSFLRIVGISSVFSTSLGGTFNSAAIMFLRMLSFCINSLKQKSTVGSMIKSSCFSFDVLQCDDTFLVDTLFLFSFIKFSSLLWDEWLPEEENSKVIFILTQDSFLWK